MTSSRSIVVAHPGAELYGSDRVLLDSVAGLVEAGNSVVVALPMDGPLRAALEEAGARVRLEPAFVLRKKLLKPSGWLTAVTTAIRGSRAARRVLKQEDPAAVLVNTITLPLWVYAARWRRVPAILHVHEGEASASPLVKRVLYAPALRATAILVNSEFSRDVMTSTFPALAAKTTLVPNAVPGPPTVMAPRKDVSDVLRVVFVGRLSPRKGPDLVVEAIGLLRERGIEATLTIVGSVFPGYEWFEEEIRATISERGLGDRVRLLGFHDDIWPFLTDCDVVTVPSRLDEPFGNTAVEAILASRPVVVSETSGLVEATRGIPTAIRVAPDSASAIADGLMSVVETWPTLRDRVDEARAIAEDRHSPARYRANVAGAAAHVVGESSTSIDRST